MAYRKYGRSTRKGGVRKTSRRAYTRRRRTSGVGKLDTNSLLGVVGGAVAGKLLDKVLPDTLSSTVSNGAKVGVGLAIPFVAPKGKMDTLLSGIGYGMTAEGVLGLLKDFGVISGIGGLGQTDTCSITIAPDGKALGRMVVPDNQVPMINGTGATQVDDAPFTDGTYDEVPIISGLEDEQLDLEGDLY